MQVVYEDNHIIVVYKESGEIVQGDKTGDTPLSETVKAYIKEKYQKPGAVFLGVVHRLDRPVSGLVVFARTSKALSRLNEMFRKGEVHKTYWALVQPSGNPVTSNTFVTATHWLTRNEKQNKSYAYDREVPGSKKGLTLSYHRPDRSLSVGRSGVADRTSSSDTLPVVHLGNAHPRRLEIWCET